MRYREFQVSDRSEVSWLDVKGNAARGFSSLPPLDHTTLTVNYALLEFRLKAFLWNTLVLTDLLKDLINITGSS